MSVADLEADPLEQPTPPAEPPPSPDAGWQTNKAGRQFVKKPSGRGMIFREGEESVQEAIERDAKPKQRPRKPQRPKMPDGPRKVDLKELEETLSDALKAPAMMCATFGDAWGAEHFTQTGPYLARNLILASEHNPWLRRKLEEAATGQDAMMKMVSLVGVGGALFTYLVPPVIYYLNLPAPKKTREMFGIPPRKEREPAYASSAETPEPAAVPFAA